MEAGTPALSVEGLSHKIGGRTILDAVNITVPASVDGRGGADFSGPGLRGIADRAEALGGVLEVSSSVPHGTLVKAELPCV